MRFAHPWWLAAGPLACALLVLLWRRHDALQHAALARFVSAHLRVELTQSISWMRRRAQRGLFLAAVALLCVALAGPLLGFRWEMVNRRGNEFVFAIDTSRSMATPDMKPDRLTRAKLAIEDFANRLDGDAVGIVAFAGSAFLVCPITLDYGAFHESLASIDTTTVPRGGTNISSAIREAQTALRRRAGSDKILILVTDGEDLEGGALAAAQAAKREDGLKIFTVGVGSAGGELIPIPPAEGGGFVKDATGAFVKSRLDATALKAIAAATGGFYVPLGAQGEGLESIAGNVLGSLAKHDLASRRQKIYIERFQWPLAGSLAALLGSLLIGTRRRSRAAPAGRAAQAPQAAGAPRGAAPGVAAAASLLLLAALPMIQPEPARAAASGAVDAYNAGTRAYRAGQYPQAAQAFRQSLSHSPSSAAKRLAEQEDAYYNLGNALYRTGQKTEQSAPQEALQQWNDAVKAYETALQLRANDADSKYNRDFVKRKIAELNKKQQQPGQGQPPPKQTGQQPPPGQQPGQPPPQPPGRQPQGAGPQPPPPAGGDPQRKDPPADADRHAQDAARAADNQHLPGQMSREEARELLDSVKGDERHPPHAPLGRDADEQPPDKPFKNW